MKKTIASLEREIEFLKGNKNALETKMRILYDSMDASHERDKKKMIEEAYANDRKLVQTRKSIHAKLAAIMSDLNNLD